MIRLAIFASGSGSNAEKLIEYFENHPQITVVQVYCNNPDAGVIARASRLGIELVLFARAEYKAGNVLNQLQKNSIDWIVLAGFLWLIPADIVIAFPNRIINLHPALLPKFGGKGMYGSHVHQAVLAAKESVSGITIHYVNQHYDEGNIIFQASYPVSTTDTLADISTKGQALEHRHFAEVVEKCVLDEKPTS